MNEKVYAVVGAGRQGLAAAYDLARFGQAREVRLFDADLGLAEAGADRIAQLIAAFGLAEPEGETPPRIVPAALDARDEAAARAAFSGCNAVLSAVPFPLNPGLARASIAARSSFCDLGGNTAVVEEELALDAQAKEAGVTITPDLGLAPGMANTLAVYLIEAVARPHAVRVRCGGLPVEPKGPLDYMLVFSIAGLTNEYSGEAIVLRGGEIQRVPTLSEVEDVLVDELGRLEAFTTSGGTSTMPMTFAGQIQEFDYKTCRYPGHVEKIRLLRDLGFFDTEPVEVRGADGERVRVAPRTLAHACMAPRLSYPDEADLVFLRVWCDGQNPDGRPVRHTIELIDRYDPSTGFRAMERTTGFAAAIVCAHLATERAPRGGVPLERVIPGHTFIIELGRRGLHLRETVTHQLV